MRRLVGIGLVALLVAAGIAVLAQPRHGAEERSARLLDPAARAGEGEEAEEQAREEIERYLEGHRGAAAAAEAPYSSKNTDGEAGSGGRAVAYRAGGAVVSAPEVTAQAPDARLFRTGFGSWEPSIGITKAGTIYVAARNSNVDPGVARSTDDGLTWQHSNPSEHAASLDPFVWVDRATGRVFSSDISPTVTCAPTSFSDDGGKAWTTTRVCGHTDYQKVFGGPPPAGAPKPQGYPNIVYFCAISGGEGAESSLINSCSKSLDGGKSFSLTGEPSYGPRAAPPGSPVPNCDGGAGPGVVDGKGTVYVPRGWCGEPWLAISNDEGDSWARVKIEGKPMPYDDGNTTWTNDSGVAVDRDGNLYYVWVAEDLHPYLTVSRDGGKTWAKPLDILPPGATRTSNPAIDVGDPGKIAISFVGTDDPKDTPTDKTRYNAYLAQSTDALAADPTFYAARVNDPATNALWIGACSPIRCGNMGDFYDVTIGPDGTPRGVFTDSCPVKDECITDTTITTPRGEGVVGQLVGGPPLVGTVADQQPAVTLPPAPASRTCASRRSFKIRLREPRRGHLRRATVFVNGRRVKVITGRRLRARVDLRGLPRGTYKVRVVAVTTTGRRLVRTRTYRTCTRRAP